VGEEVLQVDPELSSALIQSVGLCWEEMRTVPGIFSCLLRSESWTGKEKKRKGRS